MRKYTREELIEDIRNCYDRYGVVSKQKLNNDDDFASRKCIYDRFGSLNEACREAGVPHDRHWKQRKDKVEVECSYCGEEKKVYPYRLDEVERFFCDRRCQGDWLSENVVGEDHPLYLEDFDSGIPTGSMWHKKRSERLEIDNFECRVCGMTNGEHVDKYGRKLDVHHIVPRRKFYHNEEESIDDANKIENLITLCREHHVNAERGNIDLQDYE